VSTVGDAAVNIAVSDGDGTLLAAAPDTIQIDAYAAAEAFTPVEGGTCTATLEQKAETIEYAVYLFGGYAYLQVWDAFDGENEDLSLTWEDWQGDAVSGETRDEQYVVNVPIENMVGYTVPEDILTWSTFYAQMDIAVQDDPSYYEYGFVFHVPEESADAFYVATFSVDSDWSVYFYGDEDWTTIQEYTVSPVIDGADMTPQIAMLTADDTIRVYFNGAFVGEADLQGLRDYGTPGLAAVTLAEQKDVLDVAFDNLIITRPLAEALAELTTE
jgi:hypothetical protein